ncbi:MAG: lysylphosphatidylglycerol synthase domain-containing protein [Chitinophagaceae bacterium]
MRNKSIKLIFKTSIGLVLFFWMAYALYNQLRRQEDLQEILHQMFLEWDARRIYLLVSVVFLMVINWTIEAQKWRYLLLGTERFSLWTSLQSVLTGLAVSVITPNRIGEYMGRILFLRNVHKLQGITVTIVGSFAQLIVTGFLGLIGLIYYINQIKSTQWIYWLLAGSLVLCIVLGYFYFNLPTFVEKLSTIPFLRKVKTYLLIVRRFHASQLLRILFLSFLRYGIYTTQFVLLLKLLWVEVPLVDMVLTIWLIFWAMAIVPTIAIAEIGIRGETALYFLAPLSQNHVGIVTATILLWLINLIIPALFGCLFVFRMKIYDDE